MQQKHSPLFSRRAGETTTQVWLLITVTLVLLGAAFQAMSAVAIPVVFALLTAVVVAPLDYRLQDALPQKLAWGAHLCVMLLILGVLGLFFGGLAFAAQQFLAVTPDLSEQLNRLLPGDPAQQEAPSEITTAVRDAMGSTSTAFGNWVVEKATGIAQQAATMTGTFVSVVIIVFFIILLLLSELGIWENKARSLLGTETSARLQQVFAVLSRRLRQFLLLRAAIGVLQAVLYVGWLALFDVDLLVVWAVLTLVLTFIPNLGSIISAVLPVLYVWLTADLGTAIAVAVGILVIEQVIGNFIDPMILGKRVLLSPAVILISLLFWGWLWGIAGAFLATPVMLTFLIAFAHIKPLRPLALWLSNQASLKDLDDAL